VPPNEQYFIKPQINPELVLLCHNKESDSDKADKEKEDQEKEKKSFQEHRINSWEDIGICSI
jgi:hypothetical protein